MTVQDLTSEQVTELFLRSLARPGTTASGPNEGKLRVRVLTQNMFIRPPGIKNNDNDFKDERLEYFIDEILPNYDIVCLQEMFEFGSNRRRLLLNAARQLGFGYYVASPTKNVWDMQIDGGLVILSRFPIVKHERVTYKRGMMSDWLASKGVLYAKVAVAHPQISSSEPGTASYLHIFTTHTQASYGSPVLMTQSDVKHRLLQLHQFHNFLEEVLPKHRADGEPVVLVGDFNVDSRAHNLEEGSPYERERQDGIETSDEGKAMIDIICGRGIDPAVLGSRNKDEFKGKVIYEFEDLLYTRHGYHPVTFGNIVVDPETGVARAREQVLTTKQDNMVMHSIDYVLWYNPGEPTNGVKAEMDDVAVVPNFVSGKSFTQISDHYGVGAIISFNKQPQAHQGDSEDKLIAT
ncbi:hypothetical protein EV182_001676 [Spiromyces aspiralis]|uniref:Uncharacterized protein n=1 Tax=Spiromyces aspiralis TaxID=68401 RepID=A0ACC1HF38_9FUNG|nr:hypothetical protein EV182_001676 [Spiromyces aspiralis]